MNTPSTGEIVSAPETHVPQAARPVTTSGCCRRPGSPRPRCSRPPRSSGARTGGAAGSSRPAALSRRWIERHMLGVMRQIERFFDGGVAAADHQHALAAVEEAVAGGAGRNARALEPLLRWQAEPPRLRAGRDDHRSRPGNGRRNRPAAERGGGEKSTSVIEVVDDPGADMLGLRAPSAPSATDPGSPRRSPDSSRRRW